ncbi:hypothetical protein V6M85_13600 [Sulfolobus tengchongensis]|uniref:Uncharacterized protein n=1 Tax=Sulfolobus tengchongensis TaxID=207809 RepID=A0AAX4L2R9_9CREN
MLSPTVAIKILLIIPAIIFFFFSFVYYILYLAKIPNFDTPSVKIISATLLAGGVLLLSLYLVI